MKLTTFKTLNSLLLCLILGFLMVACSGEGSSDGKTGTVSVSLTDASTLYDAVVLNIEKVGVVTNNSGVTYYNSDNIGELPISINVLDLPNEATLFLGDIEVPLPEDGSEVCIKQIRLVLANEGNYVIEKGDTSLTEHTLKTPSGQQSGEKLLVKEEVFCLGAQDDAINVTLDFDPDTAITVNQNSANPYQFKPTAMRIIEGNFYSAPESFIQGEVKVPTPNENGSCVVVPNPIVTIESYFDSPILTSKTVALTDGPITDDGVSCYYSGGFKLLLPDQGTYDLLATWEDLSATATAVIANTTDVVLDLE